MGFVLRILLTTLLLVAATISARAASAGPGVVWENNVIYPLKSTGFIAAQYEHKSLTLSIGRSGGHMDEDYNAPRSVLVKSMDARFKTGFLGAYFETRYKRKQVNQSAHAERS